MRAVGMGVMHDRMHVLADQFLGRPAQHALGGGIDEGGLAFGIDAVDAFAGGAQDQLVLALDVAEKRSTAAMRRCRRACDLGFVDRAAPLLRSLASAAGAVLPDRAGIFDDSSRPVAWRGLSAGPVFPSHHRLGEHDQCGTWPDAGGEPPAQRLAVVAEQVQAAGLASRMRRCGSTAAWSMARRCGCGQRSRRLATRHTGHGVYEFVIDTTNFRNHEIVTALCRFWDTANWRSAKLARSLLLPEAIASAGRDFMSTFDNPFDPDALTSGCPAAAMRPRRP